MSWRSGDLRTGPFAHAVAVPPSSTRSAEGGPMAFSWHELELAMVEFLRSDPGRAQRHLAAHLDDGTGHSRSCQDTARGARQTWPCRLFELVSSST
jgi:hypothetical protein